jgi:E3 SUMO-protein ligase PIAS1
VQLTCQFDTRLIQTPVRGNLCEHIQCFSLENMVHMMHKLTPRKWRCPICKAKSFNFVVDSYLLMIINVIRRFVLSIEEITFNAGGRVQHDEINRLLDANPNFLLPSHAQKNNNKNLQLDHLRKHVKSERR